MLCFNEERVKVKILFASVATITNGTKLWVRYPFGTKIMCKLFLHLKVVGDRKLQGTEKATSFGF